MAEHRPPRVLFVLGTHRSGTSALTRVISLLGAELGPNLIPPEPGDNEAGFWEPREVVDLHDELLRAIGSAWYDTAPLPAQWWRRPEVIPMRDRLAEIARERFADAPLWALKDPRLCRLLPLWRGILGELRWPAACVLITRNPHEVADSLARRNELPRAQSYLLWLDHVLAAEENSRRWPRVFVTYDQLLGNWRTVGSRISRRLGVRWPRSPREAATEIEGFLTADHRRFDEPDDALAGDADLAVWIPEVYTELRRAAERGETPTFRRRLSIVRTQLAAAERLFEPQVARLRAEAAMRDAGLAGAREDLAAAREQLSREHERGEALAAGLDETRSALEPAVERAVQAHREELERTQRRLGDEQGETQGLRSALASYREELERTQRRLGDEQGESQGLRSAVASYREELERTQQRLADERSESENQRSAVASYREEIERTQQHVTDQQASLERARAKISGQEASLERAQEKITYREAALERAQAKITYREAALERAQAKITDQGAALVRAREQISDEEAALERALEQITDQQEESSGLRGALENYRAILEQIRGRAADAEQKAGELEARYRAQREEWERARDLLAQAQGDILTLRTALEYSRNDVRNLAGSLSWKLTSPLRAVYDFTSGLLPFAREMLGFPRHARYTVRTRGFRALVSDMRTELLLRLRRGTLAPPTPAFRPAVAVALAREEPETRPPLNFPEVEEPRASIVIPAHDGFGHTHTCLTSLLQHTTGSFEVVVVDDASRDETRELEKIVSGIRVLHAAENQGFVGSCNRGAEAARGEFLVFLNNDTIATPGWLDALLAPLERDSSVGVVGAKLVYPDGRLQEAGGILFCDASGWNYGRGDDPADPRYVFPREVDYVSGACLAVPRVLFLELGGFDVRYAPGYYEDVDLAFSARAAGKRVVYEPDAEIVHLEGASAGTDTSAGMKRFQVVNHEKFREKWSAALAEQPEPGSNPDIACFRPKGPHVLIVDSYTPRPDRDAGSERMFEVFRLLRELGCHVAFVPENRAHDGGYTRAIQALGVQALYHPFLPSLEDHLKSVGERYELVVLSRMDVAQGAIEGVRRHCPKARVVFDTVDLHFLRESRRAELPGRTRPADAEKLKREELAVARAADLTLVVSPVEKELLAREAPNLPVEIVSLVHEAQPTDTPFSDRRGILFVANFQHPPNADALEWYLRKVHPLVRKRLARVPFTVIGSNAPRSLERLGDENVHFAGFVPDLRPLFGAARLSVAPLRFGAGIKGKISTSLSFGVPVVTTAIGAEGMNLAHGEDVLIADDPEDFAEAVVNAHRDAELWARLAKNGLRSLEEGFSRDRARQTLARILAP